MHLRMYRLLEGMSLPLAAVFRLRSRKTLTDTDSSKCSVGDQACAIRSGHYTNPTRLVNPRFAVFWSGRAETQ